MTKETVARMRQRQKAVARKHVLREIIVIEQQAREMNAAYRKMLTEIACTPDIRSVHPATPQQTRLERAAAYFRAVFR